MSAASRCAACLERRRLRRKAWAHNRRARELSKRYGGRRFDVMGAIATRCPKHRQTPPSSC